MVLLKLSSFPKFSQNLKTVKMIAVAPHHLTHICLIFVIRLIDIVKIGVGYCFIHGQGNVRSLENWMKQ